MTIQIGTIINIPLFEEPIKLLKCEPYGEQYHSLQAIGLQTNQYYHQLISNDSLLGTESSYGHLPEKWSDLLPLLSYHLLKSEDFAKENYLSHFKKILPFPHQIEAVYHQFLEGTPVRFLLADDPGAGKTIMSGMLLKELTIRHHLKRVLILAPPLVLTQWQQEMNEKFNETFTIISRSTLTTEKVNSFMKHSHCLTSLNWAAREDVQKLILEADFDLVIIDEAHKMAAYQTNSKKIVKTKLYALGEKLLQRTPHALLLTATPHKGDAQNYRLLLKLLDPLVFHDSLSEEALNQTSNPYIVRRLKEDMVDLNGKSIFPKRVTKTIQYELSKEELELYNSVTSYVQDYYNKAVANKQNATTFALMILQRRLSSSMYAIEQSLDRRLQKLTLYLELNERDRKKRMTNVIKTYQQKSEDEFTLNSAEDLVDDIIEFVDTNRIQEELNIVHELISEIKQFRRYHTERKYIELEDLLLGADGLLNQEEKLLIFTESVDTLTFLKKRLSFHVDHIAILQGSQSMKERLTQIEYFKKDAQIMIATDAGGESINLQFCNQLVNYDIPWNPNKLEQRMGRIHRIGQQNDVLIVNMVANNTREGYVLTKLFEKLESMKSNLGENSVYDFLGDVLGNDFSLSRIMEDTVVSRKNLSDFVNELDKQLDDEQLKLKYASDHWSYLTSKYDLQKIKDDLVIAEVNRVPLGLHQKFIIQALKQENVILDESQKQFQISYLPPSFKKNYEDSLNWSIETPFSVFDLKESDDLSQITKSHFLYKWMLDYLETPAVQLPAQKYMFNNNLLNLKNIWVFKIRLKNSKEETMYNTILTIGEQKNGTLIHLSNNWLYTSDFLSLATIDKASYDEKVVDFLTTYITAEVKPLEEKKSLYTFKLREFISKSLDEQTNQLYDQIFQLQSNMTSTNSKTLNKLNASVKSLNQIKYIKLEQLDRQSMIQIDYPKLIGQFEFNPLSEIESSSRINPKKFEQLVREYELTNGRQIKHVFHPLDIVDYYSEYPNGDGRYIVLLSKDTNIDSDMFESLSKPVYVYLIDQSSFVTERKM